MKLRFYPIFVLALVWAAFQPTNVNAQCLNWLNPSPTTGWSDFNTTFGGAPCDDGSGCPFNEITAFQVWASEAYAMDNIQAGGTYAFSMCNGAGAGSWVPEFTIIAPSGAVDAFGLGDGDGCTITFTASEDGTYLIVINEDGQCGGGPNTSTDNGFPAFTCVSDADCEPVVTECNTGELTTTGTTVVCGLGTFDVANDGNDTIPTGGGFGWSFSDQLGGTGGVPEFTITNSSPMETWDNDLNGILSANLLDPLSGMWVIKAVVYDDANDPLNTVCSTSADSLIVNFVDSPTASAVDNGDGTATITPMGGMMPYTYMWSDGQDTQTATFTETGNYGYTVTDANGCTAEGSVGVVIGGDCTTGEMTTTGDVSVCTPDGTFDVANDDLDFVPPGGAFGWIFTDNLGGTGGISPIIVYDDNMATYDYDLNGLLSDNGFDPLGGTWVVKAIVVEDPNEPLNTTCSISTDSLVVTFLESPTASAVDNGDGTATITAMGGTDPYTYEWSDGQTTETATFTEGGDYGYTVTDANGCTAEGTVTVTIIVACETGELTTTGEVVVCGDEATFDLTNDGNEEVPANGGFGWQFDDQLGGTGGVPAFTITNSSPMETWDSDLGGILSANSLPPLSGLWVIKAVVYEDAGDPLNTVCSTSADSLIVNFAAIPTASAVDNGDGTATITASGGAAPYTYEWSDGQTTETATFTETGDYAYTVTDANGCTVEGGVMVTVVSVSELPGVDFLEIGPNPNAGALNVQMELSGTEEVRVQVIDLTGKVILDNRQTTAAYQHTFDLSDRAAGLYLIRLQVGDEMMTKRIVLQ